METGHHIISVDIGFKVSETTALAVVEPKTDYGYTSPREDEIAGVNEFEVRHLERFDPGTSYSAVAARVKELQSDRRRIPAATVLVNMTNSAPLKPFRARNIRIRPFTIINGSSRTLIETRQGVPKMALIGDTQGFLQDDRLNFAPSLRLGKALHDELVNFDPKPPARTDPMEAMRDGVNFDLVFAVGLACWWGDQLSWEEEKAERFPLHGAEEDFAFDHDRSDVTGY